MILKYLKWHFIEIPKRIVKVFGNFIWFGYNFFSINYCFKTLFNPWKKIAWSYKGGSSRFEVFTSNMVSRIMGFLMRSFIVLLWIIYEFIIISMTTFSVLIWISIPLIAILGLCISFKLF